MNIKTYYYLAFAAICLLSVVWLSYLHRFSCQLHVGAKDSLHKQFDNEVRQQLDELEQELAGYFLLRNIDGQALLSEIMSSVSKSGLTLESCVMHQDDPEKIRCQLACYGSFAQVLFFFDTLAQLSSIVVDDCVFDQRDSQGITVQVILAIPKKLLKK